MKLCNALIAAATVGLMASSSQAAIIVSTLVLDNSVDPSMDTVALFARNDGLGAQAGNTNLAGLDVTISSADGLTVGNYRTGSALAGFKYFGDPTGSRQTVGDNFDPYTWIGNGNLYPGFLAAFVDPDPDGAGTGYASAAESPYGYDANGTGVISSLRVAGIWVDGGIPTDEASTGLAQGALIGLAVVPDGATVTFSGMVGGAAPGSPAVSFNIVVPEPSALGLLALGAVPMIRRRRA